MEASTIITEPSSTSVQPTQITKPGFTTIIVEIKTEEKIGLITLNRPQVKNAIDFVLRQELFEAIVKLENDPEVRVIILTGGPQVFAAGADIAALLKNSALETFNRVSLWELTFRMEKCRKPIIAAIAGHCLGGGCELAMACDIRIAAESGRFGQPEINIGIIPGGGGLSRLPRLVGIAKAKEMVFSGKIISAEEALRINLVNKVVPDEKLMEETLKMAQAFAKHSPVALGLAKYALQNTANVDIYSAETMENALFSLAFASEDQKEGMTAFLEKRKPQYQGR
ncbi:MAG: enoyl-CoA hydratase/isomerase family protein [Syntrophomonadaceae bacterium]|jgi:enoyl-CoA hydratase